VIRGEVILFSSLFVSDSDSVCAFFDSSLARSRQPVECLGYWNWLRPVATTLAER